MSNETAQTPAEIETVAPEPTEQEQAEYARDVQKYGRDKADEIWARASSRAGVNADEFRTWQVRDLPSILIEEELTTKETLSEFLASPRARLLDAELEKLLEGKPRTAANLTRFTLKAISNVRSRPVKTAWEMSREEMEEAASRANERGQQQAREERTARASKMSYIERALRADDSQLPKDILHMTPHQWDQFKKRAGL